MSSPEKSAVISAIKAVERSSPEVLVKRTGGISYAARDALSQDIANLKRTALSVAEKFEEASAAPQTETIAIKQLGAALAHKDAVIDEKNAVIKEKDEVIKKQSASIKLKDVVILQKDAALAEKDKNIGVLSLTIAAGPNPKERACCIVM